MQHIASPTLSWSAAHQAYEFSEGKPGEPLRLTSEGPAWFAWLDSVSSFAFHGQSGSFTARKETKQRGAGYWYAYRKTQGTLAKKYLGKTASLTLVQLEQVAVALAGQEPAPVGDLPTGTTTLLFTDIEGSTRLLQQLGQQYAGMLTACRQLLRAAFQQYHGHEVDTQGDVFFVVFARATDAVAAAVAAQRALVNHAWPEGVAIRVRMGLHTGEPHLLSEGYVGLDTHLAARIMSAGHGGQVLLSQTTRELVEHTLSEGVSLRDLGEHQLKDLPHPTHLFQLVIEGVVADFPPLKSVESQQQRDRLLATKLHQPRPRSRLVSRSHLVERLQHGVERALTLVSAPAGFGKTTLLAQWLVQSSMPVAWLSLEAEDNDPTRFLSYLIAALQTLDAQLGTTALALLHTPQPPPPEAVLAVLTNDLVERGGGDVALVLDDYHFITADPILRGMTFLLEHLPPHLHLILATRADPPLLPLARLRAQGQLCEIRATDLRFGAAEASAFLQDVMGLDLEASAITTLESRTEGWIAGLQLAALSLQGRADVSRFLSDFTGSHRFVLDYLSEEVLAWQSASVQTFLLHTSFLERLSGPLCDAVTEQEGSQAMLEALDKANLFVVALDDERSWYRYHHLFAYVLRRHLQQREPTLVPALHRRASAWYEQHELPAEAVQHALAVPDFERAARLIEPIALSVAYQGQIDTMLGWLKALPEALVRARPFLCVSYARLLMFTNQLETVEELLQQAERRIQELPAEQSQTLQGWVLSTRIVIDGLSGDLPHAVSLGHRALELLPESEVIARVGAIIAASHAYWVHGDVTVAAEREVVTAHTLIRVWDAPLVTVRSSTLLARLYIMQGRLRQAAATYAQVEQVVPEPAVLQSMFTSLFYYFALGDLLREWNELDAAERHLSQGMALVNKAQLVEAYVAALGYTALARLQQARGNTRDALASLEALERLAQQRHFAPYLITQEAAVRAQIELAQGNLAAAIDWANSSGLSTEDDDLAYPREGAYLALARVRIAQAREERAAPLLQDVLRLLDRLRESAEAKARLGSVLEILVLRALALEAQGDRTAALSTLEHALVLAVSEGYIRLFVDEGAPMRALLRHAHARSRVPGYVATLLRAFGEQDVSDLPPAPLRPSALLEPFTEREREVLRLLLEGASNREIARHLVISVNTVKKHVYNICGKLGVQSRAQAIVRARTLTLL
jgi:LuxR family maltose regulon positive regulatory protein